MQFDLTPKLRANLKRAFWVVTIDFPASIEDIHTLNVKRAVVMYMDAGMHGEYGGVILVPTDDRRGSPPGHAHHERLCLQG